LCLELLHVLGVRTISAAWTAIPAASAAETIHAAATSGRRLPVAAATLAKYRCVGGGPEFRHFGRKPVYEPEALDRWIAVKLSAPKRSTSDTV